MFFTVGRSTQINQQWQEGLNQAQALRPGLGRMVHGKLWNSSISRMSKIRIAHGTSCNIKNVQNHHDPIFFIADVSRLESVIRVLARGPECHLRIVGATAA